MIARRVATWRILSRMTSVEITVFKATVIRLAAEGKIPSEVSDGLCKLIARGNRPQTEFNRLRVAKPRSFEQAMKEIAGLNHGSGEFVLTPLLSSGSTRLAFVA